MPDKKPDDAPVMRRMWLPCERITRRPELQTRDLPGGALTEADALRDATEFVRGGGVFTERPRVVEEQHDRGEPTYWLTDGFRRVAATEAAGKASVECDVYPGTYADAVVRAAGANRDNLAMRRTNADKRKAVALLLGEFPKRTDSWIAEAAGVHHELVKAVRKTLPAVCGSADSKREGKDGKEYPVTRTARPARQSAVPQTETTTAPTPKPKAGGLVDVTDFVPGLSFAPTETPPTPSAPSEPDPTPAPTPNVASAEPAEPAASGTPVPRIDPGHPLADLLALTVSLGGGCTRRLKSGDEVGAKLKAYLGACGLLQFDPERIEGDEVKGGGVKFLPLRGLYAVLDAVGLPGKPKPDKEIRALYDRASGGWVPPATVRLRRGKKRGDAA